MPLTDESGAPLPVPPFEWKRVVYIPAAIIFGSAIIAGGIAWYWLQWSPPVYKPFADVYSEYLNLLGKPLDGNVKLANGAYQAKHEKAMILWTEYPLKFRVLSVTGDHRWIDEPVDSFPTGKRSLPARPPDNLKEPTGNVKDAWIRDQARWEQLIGWEEWDCSLEHVSYQTFEHGIMIGPFRFAPEEYGRGGEIFVLIYGGTWASGISSADADTCRH